MFTKPNERSLVELKEAQRNWSNSQDKTWDFLSGLQRYLNLHIPVRDLTVQAVQEAVSKARRSSIKSDRCMRFPEGAFLNCYVIPRVHDYLKAEIGLDEAEAGQALLSESYRNHREVASGTPVRRGKRPFRKILGATPNTVLKAWRTPVAGSLPDNSCPDLALRPPCPKVVFEAKYFRSGGAGAALVAGVYESFFYRGLPYRPAPTREHGDWDYDYACLLLYDATLDSRLKKQWNKVDEKVKKAFWQGANIFVMLLPGE